MFVLDPVSVSTLAQATRSVPPGSGPVPGVLGPDVAAEAGHRGELPPALRTAWRRIRGGPFRWRERGRRVGGGVLCDVSLTVSLQERHPAEPPTALLALRPHPPPLLLQTQTGNRRKCSDKVLIPQRTNTDTVVQSITRVLKDSV